MIDCQIRPSHVGDMFRSHPSGDYEMILLDCPRKVREHRLLERGWSGQDFAKIEAWASILRQESQLAGHSIFDTSTVSVDSMTYQIEKRLRDDA